MTPREIAVVVLVAGGVFFGLVAVVGLIRLPDLYTRAHSASKSDTLAAGLALAAVAITFGTGLPTVKTVLLLVFMLLTNPTAAHAISRAAADQGIEPWTTDGEGATATDGGTNPSATEGAASPSAPDRSATGAGVDGGADPSGIEEGEP